MKIITSRPHRLLAECAERIGTLEKGGEHCLFLVPSQYTLQAELEMMNRLDLQGSFLIDVVSPGRLRSRAFEQGGMPERIMFDERGKQMVLTSVISQLSDLLEVYRVSAQDAIQGLAQKMSSVIADLKRSGITPQELQKNLESIDEETGTKRKLKDVALIYDAYETKMAGRLADEEDISQLVREKLAFTGMLRNVHVFIYGFDMITPTFAEEILHMSQMSKSLTLAVETDKNGAPDGRLFAPVNASIERLITKATAYGIEVVREVVKRELSVHPEIAEAEKGMFSLGGKPYGAKPERIVLRSASNPRAEVHAAAAQIRRMMASGEQAETMAVVYPKGSGYGALLENILPAYGVTAYAAEKRSAGTHPLCRFILSALAVISDGWKTQDVIECIQSGYLNIAQEQADALCAYAEGTELRAQAWKTPFTFAAEGIAFSLEEVNVSREKVVEPLMAFQKAMSGAKNADQLIEAIMCLLDAVSAFDTLEREREELSEEGFHAQAEDCAQVWNRLMETLDQLHTLIGTENISSEVVLQLLSSGLSAMELAALPPAEGAIICGEIGNVRTAQVDTVFAIGMNDRGGERADGLLSPIETEEASRATGAYLGMSAAERAALEQLDILKTLTAAKERLIVSFALADETGRALREGEGMQALRRQFPLAYNGTTSAEEELEGMLIAPLPAVEALSVMLSDAVDGKGEMAQAAEQAYAALRDDAQQQGKSLLLATRNLISTQRERLDAAQARRLYGRPVMSVSRLETFAQCPYRYFVGYGLSPCREIEPGVDHAQLGTMYHEAAEKFTQAAVECPDFPEISNEECDRLMAQAVAPLIEEWRQSPLGKSARGASIAARIEKTAKRTARNIVSQYASSSFRPMKSELVFGQQGAAPITLSLADGTTVFLRGRIDRVDVMEDGKIRVIDYKSGAKKFDPTMVYWGLQLQLLIYLSAALEHLDGTSAAGFFYCRIADPTVKSDSRIKEEIEKQIAKKLSLAGITLADVEVIRAHGEAHAGMITKDGKLSGRYASSMVEEAGMEALVGYARKKSAQLAEQAYAGTIEDSPAERGQYLACSHCDYAAICGHDPSVSKTRRLAEKKLEDLIEAASNYR